MSCAPARSAMVRASLSTRWYARAERCSWRIAGCISRWPAPPNWQCSRTSAGPRWRWCAGGSWAPGGGGLAQPLAAELLVVDARHVDVDVDAVEQRSRDALLLARDDVGRAGASLLCILETPA